MSLLVKLIPNASEAELKFGVSIQSGIVVCTVNMGVGVHPKVSMATCGVLLSLLVRLRTSINGVFLGLKTVHAGMVAVDLGLVMTTWGGRVVVDGGVGVAGKINIIIADDDVVASLIIGWVIQVVFLIGNIYTAIHHVHEMVIVIKKTFHGVRSPMDRRARGAVCLVLLVRD